MIGGIILAAGQSRRFSGDKRFTKLANGNRLLPQVISQVRNSLDEVVLVLRGSDRNLAESLETSFPQVTFHCAANSTSGMGHSMAAGIRLARGWDAAMIFLGDMPYIKSSTIEQLMGGYKSIKQKILVPTINKNPGHPVLFPHKYFPNIAKLTGDQGAISIIRDPSAEVVFFEVEDRGIHFDIDTQADADQLPGNPI